MSSLVGRFSLWGPPQVAAAQSPSSQRLHKYGNRYRFIYLFLFFFYCLLPIRLNVKFYTSQGKALRSLYRLPNAPKAKKLKTNLHTAYNKMKSLPCRLEVKLMASFSFFPPSHSDNSWKSPVQLRLIKSNCELHDACQASSVRKKTRFIRSEYQ